MNIAVYVLYRKGEFDKAACFLERVSRELAENVRLYLLINDDECSLISKLASSLSDYIKVLCAGKNLGVAGGRNFLINTAIADGADYLISCDTDIIFESGYFNKIVSDYISLKKQDDSIGLVQPILLNGPDVKSAFNVFNTAVSWKSLRGKLCKNKELDFSYFDFLIKNIGEEKFLLSVLHTGIVNIWRAHFGDEVTPFPGVVDPVVREVCSNKSALHRDRSLLKQLIYDRRPVRISTTAGGVSVFHKSVYEAVGGYDEIFNPFGFEDSEYGFRVSLNGFNNYLIVDSFAIHDVFISGQNRSLMYLSRIGLLRGVESGLLSNYKLKYYAIRQAIFAGIKSLISALARREVELTRKELDLGSALISYCFEFARGFFVSAKKNRNSSNYINKLISSFFNRKDVELSGFDLQIDENVFFVSDKVLKKGGWVGTDKSLHILAYNCRFKEQEVKGSVFESRYFDIACNISNFNNTSIATFSADILSNDICIKIAAEVFFDFVEASKNGLFKLNMFSVDVKEYDYGEFSVEELYPHPNFFDSQAWLPFVISQLRSIRDIIPDIGQVTICDALERYFVSGKNEGRTGLDYDSDSKSGDISCLVNRANNIRVSAQQKRVLIFTDSRGQHKPKGSDHQIFAERLINNPKYNVDAYLCPMKWTTTLDFIGLFSRDVLATYDYVVLYTGIVDWSPRKISNAMHSIYNCLDVRNIDNAMANTGDYSKKVVNNKKCYFDNIFGEGEMDKHFCYPFHTQYEGEATINMYRLSSAREKLIPFLVDIPNLIFINSNRFVSKWDGDYPRNRPSNMSITHDYSAAFAEMFPSDRLINLLIWTDSDVKKYTCDNIHLTKSGSDFIYEELIRLLECETAQPGAINTGDSYHSYFSSQIVSKCVSLYTAGLWDNKYSKSLINSLSSFFLLNPVMTINWFSDNDALSEVEELALKSLSHSMQLIERYQFIKSRARNVAIKNV